MVLKITHDPSCYMQGRIQWGQFLTTVVVAAEAEDCYKRLAKGLVARFQRAKAPAPKVLYADNNCCREKGPSMYETLFHDWVKEGTVVRLDIRHWLHRWDKAVIKQTHAKYPAFMSAVAGAALTYNRDDMMLVQAVRNGNPDLYTNHSDEEMIHFLKPYQIKAYVRRVTRDKYSHEVMFGRRNLRATSLNLADENSDTEVSVVHKLTHVRDYLETYRPSREFWMFIFERFMHIIAGKVTSNRYPEASAVESFLAVDIRSTTIRYYDSMGLTSKSIEKLDMINGLSMRQLRPLAHKMATTQPAIIIDIMLMWNRSRRKQQYDCNRTCDAIPVLTNAVHMQVQVGYLLVSYTHEDVDQFFSKIASTLRKQDATTHQELVGVINQSYPNTHTEELDALLDVKGFLGIHLDLIYSEQTSNWNFSIMPTKRQLEAKRGEPFWFYIWFGLEGSMIESKHITSPEDLSYNNLEQLKNTAVQVLWGKVCSGQLINWTPPGHHLYCYNATEGAAGVEAAVPGTSSTPSPERAPHSGQNKKKHVSANMCIHKTVATLSHRCFQEAEASTRDIDQYEFTRRCKEAKYDNDEENEAEKRQRQLELQWGEENRILGALEMLFDSPDIFNHQYDNDEENKAKKRQRQLELQCGEENRTQATLDMLFDSPDKLIRDFARKKWQQAMIQFHRELIGAEYLFDQTGKVLQDGALDQEDPDDGTAEDSTVAQATTFNALHLTYVSKEEWRKYESVGSHIMRDNGQIRLLGVSHHKTVRLDLDVDGWYYTATEYPECKDYTKKVAAWSGDILRQLDAGSANSGIRSWSSTKELALHCCRTTRGTEETTRLIDELIKTYDGPQGELLGIEYLFAQTGRQLEDICLDPDVPDGLEKTEVDPDKGFENLDAEDLAICTIGTTSGSAVPTPHPCSKPEHIVPAASQPFVFPCPPNTAVQATNIRRVPALAPPVVTPQQLGRGYIPPVAANFQQHLFQGRPSPTTGRGLWRRSRESPGGSTRGMLQLISVLLVANPKSSLASRFGQETFCASVSSFSVEEWLAQKRAYHWVGVNVSRQKDTQVSNSWTAIKKNNCQMMVLASVALCYSFVIVA
uniref:Uncharacterized protein n=1 Tax=Branchiostoma floridae TaxID=7739 RepID=C3ZXP8_BRAFL|eukprot:XP_002586700.1 hypothetical protein BRAFLDRAFT_105506 [Branchiostoma floridae]